MKIKNPHTGEIANVPSQMLGIQNPKSRTAAELRGFGILAYEEVRPPLGANQRHTRTYDLDETAFTLTYRVEDIIIDINQIAQQKKDELQEVSKQILLEVLLAERLGKTLPSGFSELELKADKEASVAKIEAFVTNNDAAGLLGYEIYNSERTQAILTTLKNL